MNKVFSFKKMKTKFLSLEIFSLSFRGFNQPQHIALKKFMVPVSGKNLSSISRKTLKN